MINHSPTATRGTIEDRLSLALAWWRDTHPGQTTSSIMGTGAIAELESWFADRTGHKVGFAVASGTQALVAALMAVRIGPRSVVALPAYDWAAGLAATLSVGAAPIWCDVGPNGVITPATVGQLKQAPDAIIATDLHGYPVDVNGVRDTLPDTPIIEDCSQAMGAERDGKPAGTRADMAVWSLGHGKFLDAGEGGIVTTGNEHLADQLLAATQHPLRQLIDGIAPSSLAPVARIHPAGAILGVSQLEGVDGLIATSSQESARLASLAHDLGLVVPSAESGVRVAPPVVLALEPHSGVIEELRVGDVAYPDTPPSMVGEHCPKVASSWSRLGRPVCWRT